MQRLRDLLNSGAEGDCRCAYINVETAQTAREDVGAAMGAIAVQIAGEAEDALGEHAFAEWVLRYDAERRPHGALWALLRKWAGAGPPLVLMIDEIDAMVGDSLVSVLRQLRTGYAHRPAAFPQSVILCGVRDVRDYRIRASSEKEVITGGSAFNIKAESMRLGDFTRADVETLLGQHTAETGQVFAPGAVEVVWTQTRGQPWLVNALARQLCFRRERPVLRDRPISERDVFEAREALILRRDTHIDQLADKLREPRVRRVVEPLLAGGDGTHSEADGDYVRDLGLVAADPPLRVANPIYAEVLPRVLTSVLQDEMSQRAAWYVGPDGALDMDGLLSAFQEFFRANSEHWIERAQYREAGPQLVLQAFLHRVVNGRGRIERVYALGSRRVDLLVVWPEGDGRESRFVVECKLAREGRSHARTVEEGAGADRRLHGPERDGRGPLGRLRHARGTDMGREGLPGGAHVRGRGDHGVGGVRGRLRSGAVRLFRVRSSRPHRGRPPRPGRHRRDRNARRRVSTQPRPNNPRSKRHIRRVSINCSVLDARYGV